MICRWQSLHESTCHKNESRKTRKLDCFSLHGARMQRKLAQLNDHARCPVTATQYLRWVETRTASNNSVASGNWRNEQDRISCSDIRQRTYPLETGSVQKCHCKALQNFLPLEVWKKTIKRPYWYYWGPWETVRTLLATHIERNWGFVASWRGERNDGMKRRK